MQTYTFPSKSSPGVNYHTVVADDGKLLCNCRGWTNKRGDQPRQCVHTKDVAARMSRDGFTTETRGEHVVVVSATGQRPPSNGEASPAAREVVARAARAERRDVVKCPRCSSRLLITATSVTCSVCGTVEPVEAPSTPAPRASDKAPPAPMLASAMTDPVAGEEFDERYAIGWALEEKLDGHRVTIVVAEGGVVTAHSRPRAGSGVANTRVLPHNVSQVLKRFPAGIYDGELHVPGGTASDVVVRGAELRFALFDLLRIGTDSWMDQTYAERRMGMRHVIGAVLKSADTCVYLVESQAPSWETVKAIWARGGEGAILKQLTSRYVPGSRGETWLKVKTKCAAELTVIGFEEGKSGPYSVIQLRDDAGEETTVKTRNTAILRAIAKAPDAFLGARLVIAYQQRTVGGGYRHGIFDHFVTGPLAA